MKLLIQSDDFGMTPGVTEGILYSIKNGIVRNTGLFVNMPYTETAVKKFKDIKDVALGIDINLVSGRPVSDVESVKSLVDNSGVMLRSSVRAKQGIIKSVEGFNVVYEIDPFDYDQVLLETRAQIEKFISLVGRKPAYMHGHAIQTPVSSSIMELLSKEYNIPLTSDFMNREDVTVLKSSWMMNLGDIGNQAVLNFAEDFLNQLAMNLDKEIIHGVFHCGFVDQDLIDLSSFTLIRSKDLALVCSEKVQDFITKHNIELISIDDII